MKSLNPLVFVLLAHWVLPCCAHEDHGEGFHWTKEKSSYADIQVKVAEPGLIYSSIQVPGKIIFHPDHLAYVYPKVNGAISSIRKNLGDFVHKGEVLATIESRVVAKAKAEYLRAWRKHNIQQTLLKKAAALRGISAEQDYLNAELASEEAASLLEFAIQNLYALGFAESDLSAISSENASNLRFYEVRAPLKGRIVHRNLTLGEFVDDATRAFTIADFQKVWVEISIAQNDVKFLKDDLPVEIVASDGKKASVRICQFNPTISEETRTATAIATLDNPLEKWTPGEYVNTLIQTKCEQCPLIVSKEAIQKIKGDNYVFVQDHDGFVPCKVRLGRMDDKNVEILSGIQRGDHYAACNSFCLKAEHEKEEGEHCHCH